MPKKAGAVAGAGSDDYTSREEKTEKEETGFYFFPGDPQTPIYSVTADEDMAIRVRGEIIELKKGKPVKMTESCVRPLSRVSNLKVSRL